MASRAARVVADRCGGVAARCGRARRDVAPWCSIDRVVFPRHARV